MLRRLRLARLTAVSILCFPLALLAQPAPGARMVTGRVVDAAGLAVPGATVVLTNRSTGLERLRTTDDRGAYEFPDLGDGTYALLVTLDGFAPVTRDVSPGPPIDVQIRPAGVIESVTVVSAARQAELRESLSTPVNVVGAARLRETARNSVGEVLREVPGVLTRRGSEGTSVAGEQVQGIDSRQVLVLMDGQPIAGARGIKSGAINLDRQPTGRLERVEVVKGAASALFGSDAIGGVVNLITRDAASPFEASGSLSGGEHGTVDLGASVGGRRERASFFGTVGRSARDSFDLTPQTPDTTGVELDRYDGFGKVGFRPSTSLTLSATGSGYWNRQRGRVVGEAGLLDSVVDDESQSAGMTALWQIGGRTSAEAHAYATRFDETNDGTLLATQVVQPTDRLFQSMRKADASITHVLGERHMIQAGAEVMGDRYRGVNRVRDTGGHDATTAVGWAQDRISVASWLTVTVGARYDHHSIFGSAVSPKAAFNVRAAEGLRLRASYGEGFRAPDLGQLFYRFVPAANFYQVIGNPSLRPEEAESFQAGADYSARSGRFRVGVNAFRNRIDDLIEAESLGFIATPAQLAATIAREQLDPSFNPLIGRQLFVYRNIADAKTQGVELDGEAALGRGLQIAGAYTFLEALDLTRNQTLAGRHGHQGHARLTWASAPFALRAELRGSFYSSWIASAARGSASPAVIAPKFALWDLFLSKGLGRGLDLFGAVDNLTDSQDPNTGRTVDSGAPAPIYRPDIGRTMRFGVRWTLGSGAPRQTSAIAPAPAASRAAPADRAPQASASAAAARTGILLLAHGGSAHWNENVRTLAARVDQDRPVEVAFGMATRANIQAAADKLAARGVERIVAVPLFVSSHSSVVDSTAYLLGLRQHAPADLAIFAKMSHGSHAPAAGAGHEGHASAPTDGTTPIVSAVPVTMTPALDAHPILAAILADRARAISTEPSREAIVLVAHGPGKDEENARWLQNLAALGSAIGRTASYASIDYLTVRDDAPAAIRDAATAELRGIVEKRRAAGTRVLIVPVLMSFGGIEQGIRKRLDGLEYTMASQAIMPDARLVDWIAAVAR
jgi:outer membrane receptor for ferrienterochelin and colicins